MAMTVASGRQASFNDTGSSTPDVVGPSTYQQGSGKRLVQAFPPFAASTKRDPLPEGSPTPGPGAYVRLPVPDSVLDPRLSSSFATDAPRTAPIAPNSTPFKEWEGVAFPGPGEYMPPSTFGPKRPPVPRKGATPQPVVSPTHTVVPSIPRRDQSQGYKTTKGSRNLTRMPPPKEGDRDYNPDPAAVKPKPATTQFGKQSSRAPTRSEANTIPGPGSYFRDAPQNEYKVSSGAQASVSLSHSMRSVSLQHPAAADAAPEVPTSLHPAELRHYHGMQTVHRSNLPLAGSTSPTKRGMSQSGQPVTPVPQGAMSPIASLGRSTGSRPWSKPEYFFRTNVAPSAAFASTAPGPGGVFHKDARPGSRAGLVPVDLSDPARPATSPEAPRTTHPPDMRPVGTPSGRFAPAVGLAAMPGPGHYTPGDSLAPPRPSGDIDTFEFGSRAQKAARWEARSVDAPYTDKLTVDNPGPGAYNPTLSDVASPIATDRPRKLRPSTSAPFLSTVYRECHQDDAEPEAVGPGAYVHKDLAATLEDKAPTNLGTSAFLSTSKRSEMVLPTAESFDATEEALQAHIGTMRSPQRATEATTRPTTVDLHRVGQRRPLSKAGSASFASSTRRSDLASSSLPPGVAPGSYNSHATQWGSKSMPKLRRHRYKARVNIEDVVRGGQPTQQPFIATTKRFQASRLQTVDATPGPGTYTSDSAAPGAARRTRKGPRVGTEARFLRGRGDYAMKRQAQEVAAVGPGSYNVASSFVKRSFNLKFIQ